jgi:hypothetical protein
MAPEFRAGNYGAGVLAGVQRLVSRIAEQRNVTLQGVPRRPAQPPATGSGGSIILALFIAFIVINAIVGGLRGSGRSRRWGGGGWSGWNSGVGPFGGGGGFGGAEGLVVDLAASAADEAAAVAVDRRGRRIVQMTRQLRSRVLVVVMLLAAVASSGCSYNRFVSQEEAIKTQWAQVENQLQRRNDLIPNLVETTKGIAQQEKDVFGQIAESRAKLSGAQTPDQTIQAANQQSAALARLLVIVENYPQLRSNEPSTA